MNTPLVPDPIESDALKANLAETAGEVTIRPEYQVLLDIVRRYHGISGKLENLLYEISHPYRNWTLIIPELRAFVLKNLVHYQKHGQGPQAFALFTSIFLEALADSRRYGKLAGQIMEAMLAYTDKLLTAMDPPGLARYQEVLNSYFKKLEQLDQILSPEVMMYMVQGHHPMKKMALRLVSFAGQGGVDFDYAPMARLMKKVLQLNYRYWLSEEDPQPWFINQCGSFCDNWEAGSLLEAISHDTMRRHLATLEAIDIDPDPLAALRAILELPNHMDIVRLYRAIPGRLARELPGDEQGRAFIENRKLVFLFRIMDTAGLYLIHEETLREINRSLVQLIRKQSFEEIEQFFVTTFQLLKANVRKYPHTSLQCIQVIGGEVFKRGNSRLVEAFLWEAVRFGFQYANVRGVDEDWQPITNPAHLANIRVWLNLIMQEPKWCSTLFSALIINIKLSGTCVKDTDLFQRDITELLNHPISPIYNLAKQFTKLMPVFFNEIGAEGELREVSTELDEVHKRRDRLIHFLRKQSHVESSNLIVDFIKAIFTFWSTLDKKVLRPFLPDEVLSQVETSGPFVDDMHRLTLRIRRELRFDSMQDLLQWQDQKRWSWLEQQQDIGAVERRRFELLVRMFKLLHQKYNLGMQELRNQLRHAARSGFPEMEDLLEILDNCDAYHCLDALLTHLERLKEIILSPERFEPREEIYYKRHIAVDIPSVYGRYSERKFDALGLTFRLENLANIYLEKLSQTINLEFITQATFFRIVRCLRLYLRALKVDGITSRRLDTYASLLSSSIGIKRFTYTQHLDIVRGLSEGVKDIIYAYYTNVHQNNLSIIIPQIGKENLLTRYRSLWDDEDLVASVHRLSESFFRDLIASTFGLQHLDNFILRIIQTMEAQKDILDEQSLDLLMTYNPEKTISSLYNENLRTHNLIHLGNKGFNLMVLANDHKPVPPAFIITTEIFRCWPAVQRFGRARDEFMRRVRDSINELEERTGRTFGDPDQPLLLSVRSGSAMSMPGMMTTIHNVGLNEDMVEEFVSLHPDQAYFIWDNFRRFLQSWAMAQGMGRDVFQEIMNGHKEKYGVHLKREFSDDQMRELALCYRDRVIRSGFKVPDDPWLQLIEAVEMVLASWNTEKARDYRRIMDVSDDWGTAVIVQAMVYGNLGPQAGSGVLFTAHPYRKVRRVALWGDYAPGDQGEDIVSGLVTSYPVSVEQAKLDGRSVENSLERRFPEIYARLLEIARDLVYTKEWNPQEIEFTFESPSPDDLYILQTRDMITIKKKERFKVFEETESLKKALLGKGIGVSGSALSGRAVFTEDNIRQLRARDPETPLILIRQDTVPEDIREISLADGLLTSRGGQTSHASVVATRLEKTCVVGCRDLQVYESREYCEIGNHRISFGDPISIDGRQGLVIDGMHPVREEVHILPI
ncbi:phosphoenolpyruvate synthase/pyruvate phosphate dikinase [Desulfolithobacter dissulfuricans]|uniref:Phosphoenolpyruvate synthase/pyruvate phosphate dikinase n=1 Tax=Desulfolithobacter dissulfuricans TaxID=2795293 RepID=A0A915XJD0_9BACT|nr:PEP/pyruvate-binding domain-containing protein [Desulfolithobacter dissulfuricans]BCO10165.1 phosphoenolpyruvate synthase/pyruvate phosphate dikinase [Desulfolithobacter dissulfuricans]